MENFSSIITDFLADLSIAFPEYVYLWDGLSNEGLYEYCLAVFPERFFDILYQNDEIFLPNSEINTMFLPNVEFKMLFSVPDISENTKQAIWKYLQLILITIMGNIKSSSSFGDAASLFEGINEEELQKKLGETLSGLTDFFKNMDKTEAKVERPEPKSDTQGTDSNPTEENFESAFEEMFENMASNMGENTSDEKNAFHFDADSMPNVDEIHSHLKGLFDGKIGALAKELAEEMSGDVMNMFDDGSGDIKSTGDILKKMMRNPKQIMDLVKKISTKLDDKMKSGNISQEEIMKEAADMMSKMKGMGNGKEFGDIMKNMMKSMGPAFAGGKMDMNKMNAMMNKTTFKDKMRSKLEQRKAQATAQAQAQSNFVLEQSANPKEFIFKIPDEGPQEKSAAKPPANDDWLEETSEEKAPKKKTSKKSGKKGGKK